MDYNNLSNAEINRLVAESLGYDVIAMYDEKGKHAFSLIQPDDALIDCAKPLPDYCNSPADAWPIIIRNKISLNCMGQYWEINAPDEHSAIHDMYVKGSKGILRAAMIVYLNMKSAK